MLDRETIFVKKMSAKIYHVDLSLQQRVKL
jgi:hypothetical protein